MTSNNWSRGRDYSKLTAGMLPVGAFAQARGDSGNILEDELTAINDRVIERSVPRHPLLDLISFDLTAPAGAVATSFVQGESRAQWKSQGPQSDDMDFATLGKKKLTIPVEHYFSGYELWERERKAIAMLSEGDNTIPRKAASVLQAYRTLLVDHFLTGDLDAGIEGILNTDQIPNTRRYKTASRLSAASTADATYTLIKDLCFSIGDVSADIFGDEGGYACALPSNLYRFISGTFFTDGSANSILERLEKATGFVFIGLRSLGSISGDLLGEASSANVSCALVGRFDASSHQKQLPEPINFMSPHVDSSGMRTVTPTTCAIGGIHFEQPLAFATARNIWSDS
jgi:hypothetical protein